MAGFEIVDSYKYLGVHLDASLTMQTYKDHLKKKIGRLTGYAYKFHLR